MRALIAVAAMLALTACPTERIVREDVNFASDPRILRGAWSVALEARSSSRSGEIARLDASATYHKKSNYDIAGRFRLGNDAPLVLNGSVFGESLERYIQPQVGPLPVTLSAALTRSSRPNTIAGSLNCWRWGSIASTGLVYDCLLEHESQRFWFSLRPVSAP